MEESSQRRGSHRDHNETSKIKGRYERSPLKEYQMQESKMVPQNGGPPRE